MAPLPKRRHSTRRGGKRKAAIRLSLPEILACKNCGKPTLAHRVCKHCGWYGGKQVIKSKTQSTKS